MNPSNSTVWAVFPWLVTPMKTRYVEKPLRILKKKTQLLLECAFCSPDVIHMPCNILGCHFVWPFQSVAVSVCGLSVCGRSGLWPFRSVTIPVCGRFGLWLFWFVAFPICGRFGCGRFGLWPLWPVTGRVWFLVITATNRNGQNINGHKPQRPQTETATKGNDHKPKWPQT